jgi:hypothetical protein
MAVFALLLAGIVVKIKRYIPMFFLRALRGVLSLSQIRYRLHARFDRSRVQKWKAEARWFLKKLGLISHVRLAGSSVVDTNPVLMMTFAV